MTPRDCAGWCVAVAVGALAAMGVLLAPAAPASAAEPPPHWNIDSRAAPSTLPAEGEALLLVTLSNLGGPLDGATSEVHVTDNLPEGVEVKQLTVRSEGTQHSLERNLKFNEEGKVINPRGWTCELAGERQITCSFGQVLPSFEQLEINVLVKTHVSASSEPVNEVRVSGGEAPEAALQRPMKVSGGGAQPPFGIERFEMVTEKIAAEGEPPAIVPDWQAGSHPFQLTSTFDLNQDFRNVRELTGISQVEPTAPAQQRNVSFELPPGLIGDANVVAHEGAVQQCSGTDFGTLGPNEINFCPPNTAVGVATLTFFDPITLLHHSSVVPVFNLVPAPGEPARLGFSAAGVPVLLDTSVRTGRDYGVTVTIHNASQAVQVLGARVTIWGVPEDPAHNSARGWACLGYTAAGKCEPGPEVKKPSAFLTLPTACTGRPLATVTGESWPHHVGGELVVGKIGPGPGENAENSIYQLHSFTGCEALEITPTLSVEPERQEGNVPTGLTVRVKVPQEQALEPGELAQSALKDTTIEFPTGVLLNPANANGLEACGENEPGIGFLGAGELEPGYVANTFTANVPECPEASKVGSVSIRTPDLPNELRGGVYVAAQNANPFGSLFATYIIAQDPVSKVLVKLAGEVSINPTTGRVTSTFLGTPDVPFEELTLHLFGGEAHGSGRTTFTTPPCGPVEPTKATFVSWSGKTVHEEAPGFVAPECPGGRPLAPSIRGSAAVPQAGAFSAFELTIENADSDQRLTDADVTLPPGLAAVLASVTPCQEPQASSGTCGPESLIGHATAAVGLGGEPFVQSAGRVYLTGPYEGAPFGLSIVVPTKAGPFDFGNVVTRSTIEVDETTAAVTIGSPLPTFVNTGRYQTGVPVQLKQVHVRTDRANFQFNPTNCTAMPITASFTGNEGGKATASAPFQVDDCGALSFAPKFSASVAAQGSKADGTAFSATVESGGVGVEGIRKVFLTIPKILPARLQPTLQNACLDSVFSVNPAGCPEDSFIGMATVYTPVLKAPLTGPAILVSHGNTAFPDVEFMLQGEGIHILLDGKTDIKNGVTYSRFESAPDAPLTKFVTELPAGPHSIFTDNTEEASTYNLCGRSIVAPTEFTAQDGRVVKQETKVAVVGCGPSKLTNAQKLAAALKACRKKKGKSRRKACERAARKRYGPKSKKHSAKAKATKRRR